LNTPLAQAQRFAELDGLRGIAALGVAIYHFGMAVGRIWPALLDPLYERGLYLVDLFFVLSGFVLTHAIDRQERRKLFGRNVLARIYRLYPLHGLTLVVTAILWMVFGDLLAEHNAFHSINNSYHFFLNALLLQSSSLEHDFSFNTPSWSISTEFLVNTAWFALLCLPRRLSITMVASITLVCGWILQSKGLSTVSRVGGIIDTSLLRTALGFFSGVWAYKAYSRVPRTGSGLLLADLVAVVLVICTIGFFASWNIFGRHPRTLMVLWSAVVFPSLLVAIVKSRYVRRTLTIPPMAWLGKVSFSLYLTHVPLLYVLIVIYIAVGHHAGLANPEILSLFMTLALLVAGGTTRYFESPVNRLRHRQFRK
jgi:peptidoglycan/LPS O-acetylase OafA/YrhL